MRIQHASIAAVVACLALTVSPVVTTAVPAVEAAKPPTPSLALSPCPDEPTFKCGTLPVPLNRRHPDGRTIPLHIEVFPHTGPVADGAVFTSEGGPGASVTLGGQHYVGPTLLADVSKTRDVVFIDQRGVGLSAAINCDAWQHGGPFYASAAKCHDQLGDSANFYSTTDVADDLEDVRRALGYGKIDLLGGSYAGNDMLTYTARWTRNVRSIVIGSPAATVGTDPFYAYAPKAWAGMLAALCGRTPACHAANPDPAGTLYWLAARLRGKPLKGTGIDSHGLPHKVTVTENLLANGMMFYGDYVGPAEIVQAATALRHNDPVPLLRLAANVDPANGTDDSGSPREESRGHWLARTCVDQPVQWDKSASAATRQRQYAAAYKAEPAMYGPVSKGAWAAPGYAGYQPLPCIASTWEDRPNFPADTRITGVPALVMAGELDFSLPPSVPQLVSKSLVGAKQLTVAGSGHTPWFWSDCAAGLMQRFILIHDLGDTSCARVPESPIWLPGSFPVTTAGAPAARQTHGLSASTDLRRAATVIGWTVMDGLQEMASIQGVTSAGLRGGAVTYEDGQDPPFRYNRARFTRDLSVTGAVAWEGEDVDGEFTVKLPNGSTATGTVRTGSTAPR
jgi:pimeloyl-ACP methyl ester carboxylesterase